jgi:hypothetical protein
MRRPAPARRPPLPRAGKRHHDRQAPVGPLRQRSWRSKLNLPGLCARSPVPPWPRRSRPWYRRYLQGEGLRRRASRHLHLGTDTSARKGHRCTRLGQLDQLYWWPVGSNRVVFVCVSAAAEAAKGRATATFTASQAVARSFSRCLVRLLGCEGTYSHPFSGSDLRRFAQAPSIPWQAESAGTHCGWELMWAGKGVRCKIAFESARQAALLAARDK